MPAIIARKFFSAYAVVLTSSLTRLAPAGCLLVLFCVAAIAQDNTIAQRGIYPGASYAVDALDTINTTNGNLTLHIPLASLPSGRGGNPGFTLNLLFDSKLFDSKIKAHRNALDPSQNYDLNTLQLSNSGGWHFGTRYIMTVVKRSDMFDGPSSQPHCPDQTAVYVWKLKMSFPDGSIHEFRPTGYTDSTQDRYYSTNYDGFTTTCSGGSYTVTTGMTYYSVDGTYLRLVVGHDGDGNTFNNPWTLYYPDGHYITDNGNGLQKIYDRNGNFITIQGVTLANGHSATQISDQMGRMITDEYDPSTGEDYVYTNGFGGAQVQWTIKWKAIWIYQNYITNIDFAAPTPPGNTANIITSIPVVDQLILPTQAGSLTYTFSYNASSTRPSAPAPGWGELTTIMLPWSGAQIAYKYANDGATGLSWQDVMDDTVSEKDVTYNQEYDGTGTPVTETWTYSISPSGLSFITAPDGGVQKEYFHDTTMGAYNAGTTYKSVNADGSVIERLWLANVPTGADSYNWVANPYVKTEFRSLPNAAGQLSQTAIKDYTYDKNGNVTSLKEYDWVAYSTVPRDSGGNPTGVPAGAPLKRVTTYNYADPTPDASNTTISSSLAYYNSGSWQKRDAVTSIQIGNGSQTLAYAENTFDNAATTGNVTLKRSWASTKGAMTVPLTSSNSISLTNQYDGFGNVTLATDGVGNQQQITYGPINGYSNLYPTQTISAYGTSVQRTMTIQYDFNTGVPTLTTDVDNNVATQTTCDALGRPTLVQAAVGKVEETRTSTVYDDVNRMRIVKSDRNSTGDGMLVTITHVDQLGRVRLERKLEDATTQSATDETTGIKVQTRYTYSGSNAYQLVSNPYRAATSGGASGESTMGWTRTKRDLGGRVIEVQFFTGSGLPAPWGANTTNSGTVTTAYDSIYTTVTDQAGNLRRTMTDGLGRLARTDEPDSTNNLGATSSPVQPTSYTYDGLSNLTQVTQGAQTRTFVYDSLKRLTNATNPENGSLSYTYDNNGNMLSRTDARNFVTNISYDALNRPTSKSFQNDGGLTSAVAYFYDSQTLPSGAPSYSPGYSKGRLVAVTYGGTSAGSYSGYDALGRVVTKYQQTDSVNYLIQATYYADSSLNTETYPSVPGYGDRRTVTYTHDNAGRVVSLASNATSYAAAASVSNIGYTAHNELNTETYGNSLVHAIAYNSRLQANEIKLGTSGSPTSVLDLSYNYGTTNNNGNVQSISYSGGGLSYTQTFGYDSLNRLSTSNENSGSSWSQTNHYDQYGNRQIDFGGGTYNLTFSATTNRISTSGFNYDSAGNLTNDTIHGYNFDAENKIAKVDSSTAFVYDGEGQRVKKLIGENTRFIYGIGGHLIMEFNGSTGTLQKEYVNGGAVEATIDSTHGTQYTMADILGSPRVVTNSSGSVVSRHDYRPFGEELFAGTGGRTTAMGYNASDGVRQHFTEKERDSETGLDWFGPGRYYSSTQGRFTSVDPLGASAKPVNPQTWNRYTYCWNRPIIAVDPDGLSTIVIIVSPRSSNGSGSATLQVFDRNGNDVNVRNQTNRVEGRAVGQGIDRRRTNNDTPFGVYAPLPNWNGSNANATQGGTAGVSARGADVRFGTGIITLSPVSGEVADNHRSTIYIHGGGRPLTNALDDQQPLTPTEGCVRVENVDINALISTVNTLANNQDPLTNVFIGDAATINAQADQKDKNGNYLYPQLRNAGFGTPDPQATPVGNRPPQQPQHEED